MYHFDNRIVITLDAGGTNLVFGAMRGCEFIVEPVTIPSRADNLDLCLQAMVNGFKTIIDLLDEKPVLSRLPSPARPTILTASWAGICPISQASATVWLSARSLKRSSDCRCLSTMTATCLLSARLPPGRFPKSTTALPNSARRSNIGIDRKSVV